MTNTLASAATASPSARCFSTTVPSKGARSSKRLSDLALPALPLAPMAVSFCVAFCVAMRASCSAVRAAR